MTAAVVDLEPHRGADDVSDLAYGMDFRQPQYRREVFLRFYEFHLRYRSHPGAVYYVMPFLRDLYGWDDDQALWFAFLNGNTQNPVSALILHQQAPSPDEAERLLAWWPAHRARVAYDTDRRHHRPAFPAAVRSYLDLAGPDHVAFWRDAASRGFGAVWAAATSIYSFGRLSAFSYAEYLRIMGLDFDCDDLFIADRDGSRSHRNGLCKVLGRDDLDWHSSNPAFDGRYPQHLLAWLATEAVALLAEARSRFAGAPFERDVSYFTLESALCTFKSWHRPNRRYPNVYNDLFHDRLLAARRSWPEEDLAVFWEARRHALPPHLRLEDSPHDPGCVPVKQNHYLDTGQVIMMHRDWPCFVNPLNEAIDFGDIPVRPHFYARPA